MKKNLTLLFVLIVTISFLQSCKNSNAFSGNNGDEPQLTNNDHLIMATLYQQTAAEYRALCYQAFNMARYQLDQNSKILGGMKKQAIVVDIDETMLDNSPYEAMCVLDNLNYPEGWEDWMNKENAKAIPGALEFLKYAQTKGVDVYYITNRKEKYRKQTLKNLKDLGFPNASDDHLFLRMEESSKKARREKVSEMNRIVMLIGDNLNDFSEIFEKKPIQERFNIVDRMRDKFGTSFIVLPNPMYGEWEGALYNYDYSQTEGVKSELRKDALTGF